MEKKSNTILGCMTKTITAALLISLSAMHLYADPLEDFRNLLVEGTDYFTLTNVEFDEEAMFLKAEYNYEPLDETVTVYLEYDSVENMREYVSAINSVNDLSYSLDRGELWDLIDRQEMRQIRYRFDELVDEPALFRWQYEHSALADDNPVLEILPIEAGPFSMYFINQANPKQTEATYYSETSGKRFSVSIIHGEAARMYHSVHSCNFPDQQEINVDGTLFYTQHREIRNDYQAEARHYDDGIALEFTYRYEDGYGQQPDKEMINDMLAGYASALNMDQVRTFDYPSIEGVEFTQPDAAEFAAMFPEPHPDLELLDVVAYDDALHIRADFLHTPDDTEISYHLAYRNYRDRFYTRAGGGSLGNFNQAYEICLREGVDHFDIMNKIKKPDEKDLVHWEFENIDLAQQNPLAAYFPLSVDGHEIASFSSNADNLTFQADYVHPENEQTIGVSVVFGDEGVQRYSQFQLRGFEDDMARMESQGVMYYVMEIQNNYGAYTLFNDLLVQAGIEGNGSREEALGQLDSFLTDMNAAAFAEWQAPSTAEMEFDGTLPDGTSHCLDTDCMNEKLAACDEAGFGGNMPGRLGVLYKIEGAGNGQCRMSMMYTRNPNDEWEEQPLYFYMSQDEDFRETVPEAVTDCMEGRTEDHNCHGPLLDVMNQ